MYEAVIGLEIHAQLKTKTKIFCSCPTTFGNPPNSQICPVCSGQPGALPVLNQAVLDKALLAAIALNCRINPASRFARKNYFYPDLPKGYQISQFEEPLGENGYIDVPIRDGNSCKSRRFGITRIHMEEDAGKLIHEKGKSLVDLNRAGVPLVEIVSAPDLSTPYEAAQYMRTMREILVSLDVSDGNMEQGNLRCDANISLRPIGRETFGTKTELKNINSFKFVEKAIAYEIKRQRELLTHGQAVIRETRLWDSEREITYSMREKEGSHDYRYFPEPDLLPISLTPEYIESIRVLRTELPFEREQRFQTDYGLSPYDAEVLAASRDIADFFDRAVRTLNQPKQIANLLMGEFLGHVNQHGLAGLKITPDDMCDLQRLIDDGTINTKIAKAIVHKMIETGKRPRALVDEMGLAQMTDYDEIVKVVVDILDANPGQLKAYLGGKSKLLGFFIGLVMKATHGKANPKMVNEVLREVLSKR